MKMPQLPIVRTGILLSAAISTPVSAAAISWSGITDVVWGTGTNWSGNIAPADDITTDTAIFSLATYPNQPDAFARSVAGLVFGDGVTTTAPITIVGDLLTIGAGGIDMKANAGATTLDTPLTLGAAQTWRNDSAGLLSVVAVSGELGPITNGGFALTVDGSGPLTLSRAVTGSGALAKNGAGTLTLSAANTFTGNVDVSGGIITSSYASIVADSFLGGPGTAAARRTVNIASGATVSYTGTTANSFLNLGGNVATGGFGSFHDINISGTLAINDGGTVSQILQSSYHLSNGGIITNTGVAHTNPYGLLFGWSGAGGGNIQVTGTGNQITADRIGFFNGATITTNPGAELTISSIIKNATTTPPTLSTLTKAGTGLLTLTGINAHSGGSTVNAGTLRLSGTGGTAISSIFTVNAGGTLELANTSSANNTNRLATLVLSGGTFNFSNSGGAANYSEAISAFTLVEKSSTVTTSQADVGQTSTLTFASLSRTGGTINFTGTGLGADSRNRIIFTTAPTVTNGILGAWATCGDDLATYNATDGIKAFTSYTDVPRLTPGTINHGATTVVRLTEGTGSAGNIGLGSAVTTIHALYQSSNGGSSTAVIDPADQTLQLNSILIGAASGGLTLGTGTNNGTLQAATAGGTIEISNLSATPLTIHSAITNNTSASGLTKTGSGTLTLTGANGYTGATTINTGTVLLSGGNDRLATTGTVNFSGNGTLDLGNTNQTLATIGVTTNGVTGTVLGTGKLTLNGSPVSLVSTANSTSRTLNLSGLANFEFNNASATVSIEAAIPGAANITNRTATLTLAPTSVMTAAQISVGTVGGTSATSGITGAINFGSTATLNANTIVLGGTQVAGRMGYLPGTTNATLTIRGTDGSSRVGTFALGQVSNGTLGSGTVDLSTNVSGTGTLDALITNLIIGQDNRGAGGGGTNTAGTFVMKGGTLDATNMLIGHVTLGTTETGTRNVTGTFTSGTGGTVKVDTLKLGDVAQPTASLNIAATFNLNGGATVLAKNITPGGAGTGSVFNRTFNWNDGIIRNYDGSSDLTISSGLTTFALLGAGTHTFQIDSGRWGTVNQAISGDGNLAKDGAGKLTLASANTYTGTTTVSAGTLLVNNTTGSGTGTGAVTVAATSALGGTGTIGGAATVQSGGTLAPGNSTGNLSFSSTVDVQGGSTYAVEIAGAADCDKITASDTVTLNGTVKVTLVGGYSPATGTVFDLVDGAITGTPTFDFSSATLVSGLSWDTTSFTTNGTISVTGTPSDPFIAWASANGVTGGKNGDDDNDGVSNLMEFATAANPQSGSSGARVYPLIHTLGGQKVLTYTVATRAGASFAANGSKQQADKDQVRYAVEASNQLGTWDSVVVSELAPADATAVQTALGTLLNGLDPAWQWHSFRTDGDLSIDPSDFIRLNVTVTP